MFTSHPAPEEIFLAMNVGSLGCQVVQRSPGLNEPPAFSPVIFF